MLGRERAGRFNLASLYSHSRKTRCAETIDIAFSEGSDFNNSICDGFLGGLRKRARVKRKAGAIKRFPHDAGCFGIKRDMLNLGENGSHLTSLDNIKSGCATGSATNACCSSR
jgi:hypothetical protein